MAQERQNPLQRIFASLFKKTATKEPIQKQVLTRDEQQAKQAHLKILMFTGLVGCELPVLATFRAPEDVMKFLAFYESFQALDWHYEAAIALYKWEHLSTFYLHQDPITGLYSYSVPEHKGFRGMRFIEDENPLYK